MTVVVIYSFHYYDINFVSHELLGRSSSCNDVDEARARSTYVTVQFHWVFLLFRTSDSFCLDLLSEGSVDGVASCGRRWVKPRFRLLSFAATMMVVAAMASPRITRSQKIFILLIKGMWLFLRLNCSFNWDKLETVDWFGGSHIIDSHSGRSKNRLIIVARDNHRYVWPESHLWLQFDCHQRPPGRIPNNGPRRPHPVPCPSCCGPIFEFFFWIATTVWLLGRPLDVPNPLRWFNMLMSSRLPECLSHAWLCWPAQIKEYESVEWIANEETCPT